MTVRRSLSISLLILTACSSSASSDDEGATAGSDIVGGTRDLRWPASGYLVSGNDRCSGTLISPNVVVTAGHCVLRAEDEKSWSFGTGETGGTLVKVAERHVHPEFHPRPDGTFDVPYYLRKNDVAYLVLEHAVSTKPAEIPDAEPEAGCNVQAIGYHDGARMSTPACVLFNVQLGDDPIFEVHPQNKSGLCNADGDEGSPVVLRDDSRDVLVGFYVGSVTQGITDCKKSVQFLDGYESAFGYRAFFQEGIARGVAFSSAAGAAEGRSP
jgi:hypothetical protein